MLKNINQNALKRKKENMREKLRHVGEKRKYSVLQAFWKER